METKELKTISDYQEAFAKLTLDFKQKFGAEKVSVYKCLQQLFFVLIE